MYVDFEIIQIKEDEKEILKQLLEFYLYDFNLYYEDDLNNKGRFDFLNVEPYFNLNNHKAYFIKVKGNFAGFVLLIRNNGIYTIEEFWIMPKYRKGYFAFNVLSKIIDMCHGKVEFVILNQNEKWLNVVKYLANKNYKVINTEEFTRTDKVKFTRFQIIKI